MTRTERITLSISVVALLFAVAAFTLPIVMKASPSMRLARLAGPLHHFNDEQFDAIVRLLDRAAEFGSKELTNEALAFMERNIEIMETERDENGSGSFFEPTKQLGDVRDAQRRSDVNTILNATYQYAIDNNGTLPGSITNSHTEVCGAQKSEECAGLVDLTVLIGMYLVAIPRDPEADPSSPGSGYRVWKDENSRITVEAPGAEGGSTISVTR